MCPFFVTISIFTNTPNLVCLYDRIKPVVVLVLLVLVLGGFRISAWGRTPTLLSDRRAFFGLCSWIFAKPLFLRKVGSFGGFGVNLFAFENMAHFSFVAILGAL